MKKKKTTVNKETRKFLLIAGGLLLVWLLCYEGYLMHLGQPDAFLTLRTTQAGQSILNIFGYTTSAEVFEDGILLRLQDTPLLKIADNCNGLAVFALFAGFIAAFPGNWKTKAWFIPAGLFFLFLTNALRVASLMLVQIYHPEWLHFNHKYTFTIVIYTMVFGLWMVWADRYSTIGIRKTNGVPAKA